MKRERDPVCSFVSFDEMTTIEAIVKRFVAKTFVLRCHSAGSRRLLEPLSADSCRSTILPGWPFN